MLKKTLKITGIVLLVLIGVAVAAPYLFKNQIIQKVKKEINKNLNANVDFKDVDISFFRQFPKVAIALDSLRITGKDVFANDTLFVAERVDAALNIMSVIKGKDMKIYSIFIASPRIHAIVNKDSLVNWDIMKPDSSNTNTASDKPFKMALQKYTVQNAYINYTDITSDLVTEIFNLNHEGKGDFTADLLTLKTSTSTDALSVSYGGIPFLAHAKAKVDADIQVDNKTNVYSYNTDKILLNDLQLSSKGSVKNLDKNGYGIDITFNAPSTDFKNLLSLVPVIYEKDFAKIKTNGKALFSGFVKSIYNDQTLPAYHVDLEVKDGYFQYPDLPKPLQQIQIKAQIDNPDGITDHTIVNIEKGHFEMDNDPFDIRLLVKNPVTNMFIDAAAKGKLDLGKVAQMVKLEPGTKLSGLLNADVFVKGIVTAIEQQKQDQFSAGGTIDLNQFLYVAKDYPTGVKINSLQTEFSPAKVAINVLSGQYLSTNFNGTGQINNLLNYLLQNKALQANLTVNADNLNLYEWMGTAADTAVKGPAAAAFVVPANLNVMLNSKVGVLHYDKMDITNFSGALNIYDEKVTLSNVKGNALDGSIVINGTYSTKESKIKPDISMNYTVDKVDVQKTFQAFNTVQKLMPISKFIAGKLSSSLTFIGKLGDNMMPDLNSLTGNGNLFLIEGFLSKFAPLDKIASTLNVKALEQISLKDVKNYIEFSNGKILVKPFTVKVKDIEMEIGGLQGFDQSLDYVINMKLPRSLMGEQGNKLVDNLVTQINNKGIPVKVGETVSLNILLGGFFKSPTIKTDLKQGAVNLADQLKQQALDFAKTKIDSTKQAITSAVKDSIASVKKQAMDAAKEEIARQLLGDKNANSDSVKPAPKPVESIKGLMNNLFKKKVKDSVPHQ